MKTKLFFSVLVVFFVHGFGFGQSTFTSIKTGNWEDPTTWNYTNTGVNDEDGIPDSDDEVILTGDYTITVNGDSQCKSLLSQNSVLDILSGELSVNGKVEIKASNSKNITAVFRGLGRLICNSFDLGNLSEDTKTANYTTIVKSTISLLSIDGDLTIYSSSYDNTYTNNATFSLENGGVGLVGQIKTINENKGITTPTPNNLSRSTFTNEINLGRRTLVLVSSESLSLSEKGTNLIVLDGTNSEVNYSLIGPQNIIAVDYYDLNLYSPGVKTFPNSPINIKNILTLHRNRYEPEVDLGSNVTHTAGSLVLIGDRLYETAIEQLNGTYGGYTSSATNIIGNYFVNNTGIVKVGKPCTGPTKTWNGVSWSGGTSPISSDQIIFDGNYSSSGDLLGCNCTVNSGNVIFNTGNTLTLTNEVSVLGGTLTFENNSILIQKNAVTNTGIITYKHNSNELYKNDYMVWSSPVSGMIPRVLSPNTEENGFRLFNGDTWYFYDGTYGPGAGMAAAIMAPKTYSDTAPTVFPAEFKGIPNNGDIQVQSINAFLGNEDLKPWQLIGNPYPSALDLNAFFERNYNLPRVVYFWVNSSKPNTIQYKYKSADYACYNDTGRVSTDNDIVSDIQLLRPTQAFFVKSPTQSPIVFRNSMRVSGTISPFFKLSKKVDTEKSRLWLNLTNSEGLFKQILIGYVPIPDTSFNTSYNAIDFNNNKYADFYSAPNHDFPENRLVIQGILRPFTDTDEFPLGFMVNLEKQPAVASQFTISISHTDGDFDNQAVYLYDKINNSTNDLRKGGYTFSSVDGTFDDRFVIKFINNDLGVNDFDKTSKDLIVAVKNKTISVNAQAERIDKILVYDISGKLIYSKNKIGNSSFDFSIAKTNNQVLLVKTQLENGHSTDKKVFLH